ncbi:MAG: hypothetical protein IT581_06765 [Verrucomicrobiales bacterium]|nr:hypothetical protein [Verrucomicrobiales bacterium]
MPAIGKGFRDRFGGRIEELRDKVGKAGSRYRDVCLTDGTMNCRGHRGGMLLILPVMMLCLKLVLAVAVGWGILALL